VEGIIGLPINKLSQAALRDVACGKVELIPSYPKNVEEMGKRISKPLLIGTKEWAL